MRTRTRMAPTLTQTPHLQRPRHRQLLLPRPPSQARRPLRLASQPAASSACWRMAAMTPEQAAAAVSQCVALAAAPLLVQAQVLTMRAFSPMMRAAAATTATTMHPPQTARPLVQAAPALAAALSDEPRSLQLRQRRQRRGGLRSALPAGRRTLPRRAQPTTSGWSLPAPTSHCRGCDTWRGRCPALRWSRRAAWPSGRSLPSISVQRRSGWPCGRPT